MFSVARQVVLVSLEDISYVRFCECVDEIYNDAQAVGADRSRLVCMFAQESRSMHGTKDKPLIAWRYRDAQLPTQSSRRRRGLAVAWKRFLK
eukprot:3357669-Amphidinium_carterae.3